MSLSRAASALSLFFDFQNKYNDSHVGIFMIFMALRLLYLNKWQTTFWENFMRSSHLLILNFLIISNSMIAIANPLCQIMQKKPSVACEFQLEKENYNFTENDILEYYAATPETQGLFKQKTSLMVAYTLGNLIQPVRKQTYKLTNNNEFQAQNWYTYSDNLKSQQMRWETQIQAVNNAQNEGDFNSAKRALFSKYPFSMQTYESQLPYATLAEWGGLAHPPIQDSQLNNLQEFSRFYEPMDYSHRKSDNTRLFDAEFQINLDKVSNSELSKGNTYLLLADDFFNFDTQAIYHS